MSKADLDQNALQRLRRLGGNGLLCEMIDLFLTIAPERIAAARVSGLSGNMDGLERAVHSLKSSAGNLGACLVQEVAERLEQLAIQRKIEPIPSTLVELQDAFARVEQRLLEEKKGVKG